MLLKVAASSIKKDLTPLELTLLEFLSLVIWNFSRTHSLCIVNVPQP